MAEEQHDKVPSKKQTSQKKSIVFSGPLPPPELLQRYNTVIANAADRILIMAEKQEQHRHEIEKKQMDIHQEVVEARITHERWGMVFAFVLTLLLMALGVYLISSNKATEGFLTVFSPVIFHAGNYVYNRYFYGRKEEKKGK